MLTYKRAFTLRLATNAAIGVVLGISLALLFISGCRSKMSSKSIPLARQTTQIFSVTDYGGKGDGVTDDSAAFNTARAAACAVQGTFFVPPTSSFYLLRTSLQITLAGCLGTTFDFNHAPIKFVPKGPPWETPVNDRMLYIESNYSLPRQIVTPVAVGATRFSAASSDATSDLAAGDWLVVREFDRGIGDIVSFDWVQVKSVTGPSITVMHPFRVAFMLKRPWLAGTNGLEFVKITSLLRDVTLRNCNFFQPDAGKNQPTIHVGVTLNTTILDCHVANARGQGLYLYQAKSALIDHFSTANGGSVTSEIAASVDITLTHSTFGLDRVSKPLVEALTSPLTLDFGTAFFSIANNHFCAAGNIGVQLLYGVHDGEFVSNYLGRVCNAGINPVGVLSRGSYNLVMSSNTLAGSDPGGVAIDFGDTLGLNTNIHSAGNTIGKNSIMGFAAHFGAKNVSDSYPLSSAAANSTGSAAAEAGAQTCRAAADRLLR